MNSCRDGSLKNADPIYHKKKTSFKTRKLIVFLRRNNIWIFLFLSIVVLLLPILFTLRLTGAPDFTNTGAIGDTIGGITAPFINIGAAFLLYYTLMEQIKTNKKQNKELIRQKKADSLQRTYQLYIDDIEAIRRDVYDISFILNENGREALNSVVAVLIARRSLVVNTKEGGIFHTIKMVIISMCNLVNQINASNLPSTDKVSLKQKLFQLYYMKIAVDAEIIIKTANIDSDYAKANRVQDIVEMHDKLSRNAILV